MALPTALLIKGLAGIGAIGSVVGGSLLIQKLLQPKEPNEIIKDLGIEDTACHFQDTKDKAECELEEAKVKAINFTNKTGSEQTVSGLSGDKKLKLVIEKGYDTTDFPKGLRFNLKNTNTGTNEDVTIGAAGTEQITLKPGVSYDFKVTSDGTKLEKAWTLKSLAAKVGLTCENDSAGSCTLPTKGINVWKANDDYITNATVNSGSSMSVAKDTKDYNGGFKFTVTSDITLTQGTSKKSENGINQLTKTNKAYEINIKDLVGNKDKKWFLVEKSTSS